jgi:iron(II)-dependent oxidoreductase
VTFTSNPSTLRTLARPHDALSMSEQRLLLQQHMQACRASTLQLTQALADIEYYQQSHPEFSPVGWHLGHIAFTEALWLLEHLAGQPNPLAEHRRLFTADGLPKAEREQLPALPAVLEYLATVRQQVLSYLAIAPLEHQLRLWWWLLQHESQHAETISMVLAMHRQQQGKYLLSDIPLVPSHGPGDDRWPAPPDSSEPMLWLPSADVKIGYDGLEAIDNEGPPFPKHVPGFWIDATPVTQRAFREFIVAGGYTTESFWSPEGWQWRQQSGVTCPFYWAEQTALDNHPVCGMSFYEAEAYATFVGKRLPTEWEWERAVCWSRHGDSLGLTPWGNGWLSPQQGNWGGSVNMTTPVGTYGDRDNSMGGQDWLGNVWEWTTSWFAPYTGFRAFPYRGYSEAYFDQRHRVLRGGSWATRPWALRGTLRNWYYPQVRQIFAGFRCVRDA